MPSYVVGSNITFGLPEYERMRQLRDLQKLQLQQSQDLGEEEENFYKTRNDIQAKALPNAIDAFYKGTQASDTHATSDQNRAAQRQAMDIDRVKTDLDVRKGGQDYALGEENLAMEQMKRKEAQRAIDLREQFRDKVNPETGKTYGEEMDLTQVLGPYADLAQKQAQTGFTKAQTDKLKKGEMRIGSDKVGRYKWNPVTNEYEVLETFPGEVAKGRFKPWMDEEGNLHSYDENTGTVGPSLGVKGQKKEGGSTGSWELKPDGKGGIVGHNKKTNEVKPMPGLRAPKKPDSSAKQSTYEKEIDKAKAKYDLGGREAATAAIDTLKQAAAALDAVEKSKDWRDQAVSGPFVGLFPDKARSAFTTKLKIIKNLINSVNVEGLREKLGAAFTEKDRIAFEQLAFEDQLHPGQNAAITRRKIKLLEGILNNKDAVFGESPAASAPRSGGGGKTKPKRVIQNGHEYILNEKTGQYE